MRCGSTGRTKQDKFEEVGNGENLCGYVAAKFNYVACNCELIDFCFAEKCLQIIAINFNMAKLK